jgi:hypothetical protein
MDYVSISAVDSVQKHDPFGTFPFLGTSHITNSEQQAEWRVAVRGNDLVSIR